MRRLRTNSLLLLALCALFAAACLPRSRDISDIKVTANDAVVSNDTIVSETLGDTISIDTELQAALAFLGQSDIPSARAAFQKAVDLDPTHAQAAFGLALTKLLLLSESPEGKAVMTGLDAQPFLHTIAMGKSGLFASLDNTSGLCPDKQKAVWNALPWSNTNRWGQFFDLLPSGRTGGEVLASLNTLIPHLDGIAALLKIAAESSGFTMSISGGLIAMPHLTLKVHQAEAYLLLGAVQIAKGVLSLLNGYQWGYQLKTDFGNVTPAMIDKITKLNAKFLYLKTGVTNLNDARDQLEAGLTSLIAGLQHGETLAASDTSFPISWVGVGLVQVQQLRTLATALKTSLRGPVEVPYLTPTTTANFSAFFDTPVSAATIPYDPFDYDALQYKYSGLFGVEAFWKAVVKDKFSPQIYDKYGSKSWTVQWYTWIAFEGAFQPLVDEINATIPCWW